MVRLPFGAQPVALGDGVTDSGSVSTGLGVTSGDAPGSPVAPSVLVSDGSSSGASSGAEES